jgi:hypothetical protein
VRSTLYLRLGSGNPVLNFTPRRRYTLNRRNAACVALGVLCTLLFQTLFGSDIQVVNKAPAITTTRRVIVSPRKNTIVGKIIAATPDGNETITWERKE